jgi:hypothetical protein
MADVLKTNDVAASIDPSSAGNPCRPTPIHQALSVR